MTTSAPPTTAPLSPRAREILAAVERTVADPRHHGALPSGVAGTRGAEQRNASTAAPQPAPGADRAGPQIPHSPGRTPAGEETDPLVALVLGVAEHTQQARATLDELSRALEKLARHLAFDR